MIHKDGKLYGENTDGKGFVTALKNTGESLKGKGYDFRRRRAARAIAVECGLNGAEQIYIINRSAEKGQELASLLNVHTDTKQSLILWEKGVKIPEETEI